MFSYPSWSLRVGNARYGSTFEDEGLNQVLASQAAHAHRANWEARTFIAFGQTEERRISLKRRRLR
eukprot:9092856-Alexandrium_andersonii.AAC.1